MIASELAKAALPAQYFRGCRLVPAALLRIRGKMFQCGRRRDYKHTYTHTPVSEVRPGPAGRMGFPRRARPPPSLTCTLPGLLPGTLARSPSPVSKCYLSVGAADGASSVAFLITGGGGQPGVPPPSPPPREREVRKHRHRAGTSVSST